MNGRVGVYLAGQCRQVGDAELAEELFVNAMAGVTATDRLPTTLAA